MSLGLRAVRAMARPAIRALGLGVCAFMACAASAATPAERPVVQTAQGAVQGTFVDDRRTAAFLGIPFAQPPVGALRFQSPAPATAWAPAVLDAGRFKPACMQDGKVPAEIGMSEDCLYLNVYRPDAARASDAPLPVMVFLHGGRYWTGRSSENRVEQLAREGRVIVVTPAYRLNAFGFLATPEQARRGHANAGLQDQRMALRWVAEHIGRFGGDPSRVTLFGESAGAGSAMLHLLMAGDSAGPFQRTILQSTWQWRLPTLAEATRGTQALAQAQGCPAEGDTLLDCLRQRPADKLLPGLAQSHAFQPAVDGRQLEAQPLQLLREGRFQRDVAVTLGLNANEGHFMAMSRTGWKKPDEPVSDAVYEQAARGALQPFYAAQQVEDMLSWYAPLRAAEGNWQALSRLLSDFYIDCGSQDAAQALVRHSRRPVYGYRFAHVSANHPKPYLGATHGDELDLLFGAPVYPPGYPFTAQDRALSLRMMRSWAAIAHGTDPATPGWQPLAAPALPAHVWTEPPTASPQRFADAHGTCAKWRPFLDAR